MINPLKISEMLSQANQMQEEVQRKLADTVVEASSGGGAVTATMNGRKELMKLQIDPSAVAGLMGNRSSEREGEIDPSAPASVWPMDHRGSRGL